MDKDQWLDFTIFTGIDIYKSRIKEIISRSKCKKFNYMQLMALVYLSFEELIENIEELLNG